MRRLLFVLGCATVATAAPVPKELREMDDLARLVGTWTTEQVVGDNGQREIVLHTIVVAADGTTRAIYHQGLKDVVWTAHLDKKATPKIVSLQLVPGGNGVSCLCAYDVTGDTWVLAFSGDGKTPPKSLDPVTGVTVYRLKRGRGK